MVDNYIANRIINRAKCGVVEVFMLSNINMFGYAQAATPSATESSVGAEWMSAMAAGGGGAALSILTAILISLVLIMITTRRRQIRDLTIFGALMAAIASLVLVAAIVLFIILLVLGFPSLPSPSELTLAELGSVVKVGLSVAAAVGVVVTLLVTYRKQRDSESVREAELFRTAVEQLGSDKYFMRLTGVLALRDLADRWEPWRQRCIDMLCEALVQPGEGAEGINRAIYEILRERFNERSPGWRGCSIVIAHGEVVDLDLSNLLLHHANLTLRDITISQPANLSGIQLSGNSRLVLDNVRIESSLSLTGLACQRNGNVEMNKMAIGADGVLDVDKLHIARGGTARMQNLTAVNGGQLRARNSYVNGFLVLSDFTCESGVSLDFEDLTCNAGQVAITNVDAPNCNFNLSGVTVLNGAYLRVDRYRGPGGWLALRGGRVTKASVVSLTNIMVYDSARLDLYGLYNKSGSLFHAEVVLNAGLVDFSGFENEDKGSVLILRVYMEGSSGKVQFHGGGNYRGDVHIDARNSDRSNPSGIFSFDRVNLWGGQLDLDLRIPAQILAREIDLRDIEIVYHAYQNVIQKLSQATQPRPVNVQAGLRHDWSVHLQNSPLGRSIQSYDGALEK